MCSKIYISGKTKTANLYIQKISRWRGRVHCIIKPKRLIISSSSSDPFERASALLACSANSWDARARAIIATIGFHPLLFTAPARRRPAGPRTSRDFFTDRRDRTAGHRFRFTGPVGPVTGKNRPNSNLNSKSTVIPVSNI